MKIEKALPLKVTAALAMLAAISIICGKYLAIPGGDILRFSFENLPIIFAGIAFGPLAGVLVGVVADLIGCVLVGYAINPIVTVGAGAVGLVAGLIPILLRKAKLSETVKIPLAVAAAHIVGSVLIKTFGLAVFYDMPIFVLMFWRLFNYAIVGTVEGVLLTVLFTNKMLTGTLASLKQKNRN